MTEPPRPWLPHMLFEMAESFGLAVALRFGAEFGGSRLAIPEKPHDDHAVAIMFGMDVLVWLIGRWGNSKPLVPLGPHSSYKRLIAETRRLLQDGEDSAAIIRAVGVHERTIYRHRKTLRERQQDHRQGSLDLKK